VQRLKSQTMRVKGRIYAVGGGYKAMMQTTSDLLGSQYHLDFKIEPQTTAPGPAYVYTLDDGTVVTVRPVSKSGGPALEIINRMSGDRELRHGYRFHFQ